jgi:hypothetical protein
MTQVASANAMMDQSGCCNSAGTICIRAASRYCQYERYSVRLVGALSSIFPIPEQVNYPQRKHMLGNAVQVELFHFLLQQHGVDIPLL